MAQRVNYLQHNHKIECWIPRIYVKARCDPACLYNLSAGGGSLGDRCVPEISWSSSLAEMERSKAKWEALSQKVRWKERHLEDTVNSQSTHMLPSTGRFTSTDGISQPSHMDSPRWKSAFLLDIICIDLLQGTRIPTIALQMKSRQTD